MRLGRLEMNGVAGPQDMRTIVDRHFQKAAQHVTKFLTAMPRNRIHDSVPLDGRVENRHLGVGVAIGEGFDPDGSVIHHQGASLSALLDFELLERWDVDEL